MGCPGYPWISLWFQYFRIRRHISPNPATYFDILLNNRTGVQLAGYPYDSKEMPPLIINRHLNIGLVYFSAKLLTMCKKRTLWFKTTRQWSMKVFLTLWTNIPISEMGCFVKFRWHLSCSSHPDLCNMHGCRHPLAAAQHCTNQTVVGRGFINQNPFIRFLIFGWWVQRSWGLQL